MSRYLFDNAAPQSAGRFHALESRYDPASRKALERTGIGPGWRCLEIGGGGGSLGDWLADRAGPDGEVVVTDLAPSPSSRANVRVLRHDITRDPLPAGGFDLIHARLVLLHLPERLAVLERLVGALRPGGRLVLEEFDCTWTPVLAAPDDSAVPLFERLHSALMAQLEKAGAEPRWGRQVVGAMLRAGLEDVTATTYAESWQGGGEGIRLHRVNTEQVAGLLEVSAEELDRFLALLDDPSFVVNSYPLVSAQGRRKPSS
ncbi:methyltransferase domain-containing protein [Streptomyces sp. S3(2020)]|uniref:class I SAM-dependent methyltransferase n=1 Tax=Streptomyces sp. S3(2020) TaxID=2732044 RepID=UPI00148889FB|nr:methyltransferase domain-containing protein [Streptomyces sp. S3(2020)]NNN37394.1 methyltransferase domain-containing protein [Streptomyces sp. S3(2020)]